MGIKMKKQEPYALEPPHGVGIGTFRSYRLGFFLCLVLTLAAFGAVMYEVFPPWALTAVVVLAGVLQIAVQLLLFFHLQTDAKPRWNAIFFFFALVIVAILVIGSLWIMANLDYRLVLEH